MSKEQEFKQKILIADDSEMNRLILTDMLEDEYQIIEAENGVEAVAAIQKYGVELSLILLDIVMPEMDGFGVLNIMNRRHWIEDIPVIMISSESGSASIKRAYELGITDYISRPFDSMIVHRRVVNTIMLYAKQKKLSALVMEQINENVKQNTLMIDILSHIVEFRNGESGLHVIHIRILTEMILKYLPQITDQYQFTLGEISMISTASALHDIGKISIPGEILNKPGRLTAEEFAIMKTHSAIGAEMLEKMAFHQEEPLVKTAHDICRWHHERYDGRGYPDGLKGDEIPICAQVVALADVYDALTSERVYKKAFSPETAVKMICNGECGTFNPLLLRCLNEISDTIQEKLNDSDAGKHNEIELQTLLEEKLYPKGTSVAERTLQLLQHERMKVSFYAAMSKEIQFEYTVSPSMIMLSEWGAERLHLPEVIMDPLWSQKTKSIINAKNIKELTEILRNTSPEQPVAKYDCKMNINGEIRWMQIICRVIWSEEEEPKLTGVIGKAVDIHEEKLHIDALENMASHDSLTKLLNYEYAQKKIQEQLKKDVKGKYALIFIDVDNIKQANDQYGRMFGDQVLVHVANILHQTVQQDEIAARVNGDEFMVLAKCEPDINQMTERIGHALDTSYENFKITVCMGVAEIENTDMNYDTLFCKADAALLEAKRNGAGQCQIYRKHP